MFRCPEHRPSIFSALPTAIGGAGRAGFYDIARATVSCEVAVVT